MGYNQQDAQEFLRYLLEGLHEDVNRIAVKPRPLEHDISDDLRYLTCYVVHSRYFPLLSTCQLVFRAHFVSIFRYLVCGYCRQWFGEGHGILEALLEERRLEDRGPVCWPAQINFTVHCLRSLQRDVWSLLGSLSAYPAVQQIQRQVAALPRSFWQRRNTRRRWKACKEQRHEKRHSIHIYRHFSSCLNKSWDSYISFLLLLPLSV